MSTSILPGLAAFDSSAIIPGVGLPVTASSVVLPESADSSQEEEHLYGKGKSRGIVGRRSR